MRHLGRYFSIEITCTRKQKLLCFNKGMCLSLCVSSHLILALWSNEITLEHVQMRFELL